MIQFTAPSGDLIAATVHVGVDAVADPELAMRLQDDEPARALNAVVGPDGARAIVDVPVLYHDPAAPVFVLVLGTGDRHRELAERARVLAELAAEPVPVPAYVRDFAVVFGGRGLRDHLSRAAEQMLEQARAAEQAREVERDRATLDRRRAELAVREGEVERRATDLDRRSSELAASTAELDRGRTQLERDRAELERQRALLERDRADLERQRAARAPAKLEPVARPEAPKPEAKPDALKAEAFKPEASRPEPAPVRAVPPARAATPVPVDESTTNPYELTEIEELEGTPAPAAAPTPAAAAGPDELPAGSDPLTTHTRDRAAGPDPWVDSFAASAAAHAIASDDATVRLALRLTGPALALASGPLDVRVQLHRMPTYPIVAITIGAPAALRGAGQARVTALLDPAADLDRRALAALEKRFALTVELVVDGRRVRKAELSAPLAPNVAYIVRAANDHLRSLAHDRVEPSAARGRKAATAADYDLLGEQHPDAAELRADKLTQLATAGQVRRALAVCRRFARPAREDYLVCIRGYPLDLWHRQRKAVLERAVELGLWVGADLAQVAVSEGLARSRKDLVTKLERAFQTMAHDVATNDLDSDAAEDNRNALAEEAKALGMSVGRVDGKPIASADEPVVSGTIERPRAALDPKGKSSDELLALLDDRHHRVAAALELCLRGEARAIRPVLAAARRMARSEAVRVLGASVKFGEAAAPALTAGLASSKAFLRHGCALALALLRTEAGTESVIDLLLAEPTEIWREVARAVGQVGPGALMPLASRLGRLGPQATASARERIAWAMAHIGVRGGRPAVETLAAGQSVVAPVARTALELMAPAARDDLQVRAGATGGSSPGRDVTVNRAFSRRFFEALERGLPDLAAEGLEALDASGAMEMLDDADLIDLDDADDDSAELDESDLIES
ncbi:MAG: hypothetical protein K8W52_02855 [Deltaproteobacteria bacterium]|nr:hypothetical protein [Deltaproteobacteria bacterium]